MRHTRKWGESLGSWVLEKFLPPSCFSVTPLHCSTPCRTWDCVNSFTSSLLSQRRPWEESSQTKRLYTAHASALSCIFFFQILFIIFQILTIAGAAAPVQHCNQVLPFIVELIIYRVRKRYGTERGWEEVSQNAQGTGLNNILNCGETVGQLQQPQELLSQEAVVVYLIQSRTLDDCIWGPHQKMIAHHYFAGALLHFTSYFQTNIQSSYLW